MSDRVGQKARTNARTPFEREKISSQSYLLSPREILSILETL